MILPVGPFKEEQIDLTVYLRTWHGKDRPVYNKQDLEWYRSGLPFRSIRDDEDRGIGRSATFLLKIPNIGKQSNKSRIISQKK